MKRWLIWLGSFPALGVLVWWIGVDHDSALLFAFYGVFWSIVTPIAIAVAVIRWLVKGRSSPPAASSGAHGNRMITPAP
jgi:hypothetical protein